MIDERNPYGSRGGYVRDKSRRDMRRDYRRDRDYRRHDRNYKRDYNSSDYREYDSRYDRESNDYRYNDYRYSNNDYRYDSRDYSHGDYLDRDEIDTWIEMLQREFDNQSKEMFSKEKIQRRATEIGVRFEDFTQEEFYVTVIMLFSDYKNVLGSASIDVYIKLAKAFLEDKDSKLKGAEKLATYFDEFVY